MNKPRLLLIGSITNSIAKYKDGIRERFGGGVMYGGLAAAKLDIPTTVVTIGAEDIEKGMDQLKSYNLNVIRIPRDTSNNFSNDYSGEQRKLQMRSFVKEPLDIKELKLNLEDFDCAIFYPIYHEISGDILNHFSKNHLTCLDPQGFTRELGEKNAENVYTINQVNWGNINEYKNKISILKLSNEDLHKIEFPKNTTNNEQKVIHLADNGFPIVVLTCGKEQTLVARKNLPINKVPVFNVNVADPAGAGDTFGVGFICEYFITKDPVKAAAFGNTCASFKISGEDYNYEIAKNRAEEILKL